MQELFEQLWFPFPAITENEPDELSTQTSAIASQKIYLPYE